MNKKIFKKFKKPVIEVMVFIILTAVVFILTSCRIDFQKNADGSTDTVANISTTETSADTGVVTTVQSTTSENSTTTETTSIGTDTTSETSTTAGSTETTASSQTTNQDTKQVITVTAKSGGYLPRKIEAKAGVPTILVMKSDGAYGCERAFNIPDLNISKILPENGQTEFDLGTQAKGTKLVGVCSMGMYYFQIIFN
jgi:hypothetical protein